MPSVCKSQFDVINIFCWDETKNVSGTVYTEPSTMRIGEAGFEQLANVVSFRVADTSFPRKKKKKKNMNLLPWEDVAQNVTYGEK